MEETSCQKSCAQCTYRAKLNCTGCSQGPSRPPMGQCEVYRCALGRGYEHCGQCRKGSKCTQRNGVKVSPKGVPDFDRNAYLGRWLMVLFLLFIPNNIGSILADYSFRELIPGLYYAGELLSFISLIVYGVILLRMSHMAPGYSTAGICTLLMSGINGFYILVLGVTEVPKLIALVMTVIGLVSMYNEYNGHAAVLYQSNPALAAKWEALWKWTYGMYAAMIVCPIFSTIIPILGVLGVLTTLIGLLVVMIMKLVYLWQSARHFQKCEM